MDLNIKSKFVSHKWLSHLRMFELLSLTTKKISGCRPQSLYETSRDDGNVSQCIGRCTSAAAVALNHQILYISKKCTNLMPKNHQRRC